MNQQPAWEFKLQKNVSPTSKFEVAFLLPPQIPVPNPSGNSIASIVTTLAKEIPYKTIIFSTKPIETNENLSHDEVNIAYYQKKIEDSFWDKGHFLPIVRHFLITPINYSWRKYAEEAAKSCVELGVQCFVIEDVADFGWATRFLRDHRIKIILHQHAFTQRNYRSYLWHKIEKNLDEIIFVSKKTRDMTECKHGKIKVPSTYIYNGVDLNYYDPSRWKKESEELQHVFQLSNKKQVLLFVGRLSATKGVQLALDAFLSLNKDNLQFIMICGYDGLTEQVFYEKLKQQIAFAQSKGFALYYLENIQQEFLPPYYLLSDYVIVPSYGSYEGLPKVVTEALAMGVPVIASDRGGIWELLIEGKNGWKIADPVTSISIHTALEHALSIDKKNLSKMKKYIIQNDRPKMDQNKMIQFFSEEISRVIQQAR